LIIGKAVARQALEQSRIESERTSFPQGRNKYKREFVAPEPAERDPALEKNGRENRPPAVTGDLARGPREASGVRGLV
jgi:hypothetical protein